MNKKDRLPSNVSRLNPPAEMSNPPSKLTRRGKIALGVGTLAASAGLVAGAYASSPENQTQQPKPTQTSTVEQNLEHSQQIMVQEARTDEQPIDVRVLPGPADVPEGVAPAPGPNK